MGIDVQSYVQSFTGECVYYVPVMSGQLRSPIVVLVSFDVQSSILTSTAPSKAGWFIQSLTSILTTCLYGLAQIRPKLHFDVHSHVQSYRRNRVELVHESNDAPSPLRYSLRAFCTIYVAPDSVVSAFGSDIFSPESFVHGCDCHDVNGRLDV